MGQYERVFGDAVLFKPVVGPLHSLTLLFGMAINHDHFLSGLPNEMTPTDYKVYREKTLAMVSEAEPKLGEITANEHLKANGQLKAFNDLHSLAKYLEKEFAPPTISASPLSDASLQLSSPDQLAQSVASNQTASSEHPSNRENRSPSEPTETASAQNIMAGQNQEIQMDH